MKFIRQGHGRDALILIHGFGENAYSWGELPPAILAAYSVISVDLRGHGDSAWDPKADYRLDRFVSDLAQLLDHERIDSCALAGHSLGSTLALRIATLRPRTVRKLALVEFNLEATPTEVLEHTLAQFDQQFRVYKSQAEYSAFLEAQRPTADPAALFRYAQNSVRPLEGGGYAVKCDPQLRRLHTDLRDPHQSRRNREELSALQCPLLLVRGSGSAVLTKAMAQQIIKIAPNAQLALVPGAGHSVMLDRPKEFAEIMARFLT
jgi:pimeloyl-ACP methyl ester carboxylesterase